MTDGLQGRRIAFTGKLASMTHQRAFEAVRASGGVPAADVSRRSSMLVVGMDGWPLLPDGSISQRLERAEALVARGHPIEIVSEDVFLERAGLHAQRDQTRKSYPAAVVCRLAGITPQTLRRWEALGLVRSSDGLYDYQDLVSLRTVAELVEHGVRPDTINRSLRRLARVLPGTERPLAQLSIVAQDSRTLLAEFDDAQVGADGQLLFRFDARWSVDERVIQFRSSEDPSAEDLLAYGQACEELERYEEAADAYRAAAAASPRMPEAFFNLGNALRALDQLAAAGEQYRLAVELEPDLAAAWYNLADVLETQGRVRDAIECLQRAIAADPRYADAFFNLALCLEQVGQMGAAERNWRAYLSFDATSAWADVARLHLSASASTRRH